jgi:hypothetical protein
VIESVVALAAEAVGAAGVARYGFVVAVFEKAEKPELE